jgi:hypothetical protein
MVLAIGVLLVASVTPAFAVDGSLPGGTTLSATIDTPGDGATVGTGPISVTGSAAVGAAPAPTKDTTIVYAVDVSGSTANPSGVDCNGGGSDTILTCEKTAVKRVNAQAAGANSPVANSGLVSFNSAGTAVDFDAGPATQLLTTPGSEIDGAVDGFSAGGGTSFVAALGAVNDVLGAASAQPVKIVVFLSDGLDTVGGTLPSLPEGTIVKAYAISGSNCASGTPSLDDVAAEGTEGSSCEQVTDLTALDDIIKDAIAATLTSVEIAVDGGPATTLGDAELDPDIPPEGLTGPATVSFTTSVDLTPGSHQICVTANGTDAGGSGSVTDCHDVQVTEGGGNTVDCGTSPCELTATDGNVAKASFVGIGITKVVSMSAADTLPAECGGQPCVTGFDVVFDDNGGQGIAELTVRVARKFSTPPGKAAVFLDGARLTAKCTNKPTSPIPCQKITRIEEGRTKYFVRFAADPGIRFR